MDLRSPEILRKFKNLVGRTGLQAFCLFKYIIYIYVLIMISYLSMYMYILLPIIGKKTAMKYFKDMHLDDNRTVS